MHQASFPEAFYTKRLVLRRYGLEDVGDLLGLVDQNRARLVREFAQVAALKTREEATSFISKKREQWNQAETFCYGIWLNDRGDQIGQIQVKNIAWEIPSAELGYFVGEAWQRRGYATEAIRAIVGLAFGELGFERIFVRILAANRESFALAQKLGFQPEGLHRRAFRCGLGEIHDVRYLALIQDDYRGLSE